MFDFGNSGAAPGRPGLLLRAAAAGQADYDRNRDLRRLLRGTVPTPEQAARALESEEERCEAMRRSGDFAYSPARHVGVLIALLAERRLVEAGCGTPPSGPRALA